ncbi:FAD-dependent 5-carboxymethylaminomethyl-2-thiouridine(34) oxidoreductase MnmC [Psychrobacter sp. 1U2]|uniref:FAD-dependent 5-carboxymethylaminomethyl-2-thiouridine(34) oxidoreductase MnmC n=1 Tax=Psychrobacter sp. 1U2 TaxID=3453577 RepID=UPI003F461DA2
MSTNVTDTSAYPNVIIPANIAWQSDDSGNRVPVSGEFGDVYFSNADGLAESRYVFIEGNQLTERLTNLRANQCFTIAELGFGTGLNLLAVWRLWQQLRGTHTNLATARLHFITTEKHPITLEDLRQILGLWSVRAPELAQNIERFLAIYPSLIEGCHRLHFEEDNLTVDIWLGEAQSSLAKLATDTADTETRSNKPQVDAWFLDGFAPSCNESLWAATIFAQLQRISAVGTTAATYSCAGVVKRGLQEYGFTINKVKGFGRKREMLTARVSESLPTTPTQDNSNRSSTLDNNHYIVIGAGVAGLMMAWSLVNRGIKVTLLDKTAPLAGASGNPRALLAPKMTPVHHVDEHLHTIGYLYSSRLYHQLNEQAKKQDIVPIIEPTAALDLLLKANIDSTQIADYPDDLATTLPASEAEVLSGLTAQDLTENLYLPQSGLVNPQALKYIILSHPLISFMRLEVTEIDEGKNNISVIGYDHKEQSANQIALQADNVVICAAFESHYLDKRIFDCRKIRGQLSWFTPTPEQLASLPKLPLKYGGYCSLFTPKAGDAKLNAVIEGQPQFLLGASFVRNDTDTGIRANEHEVSRNKLIEAIPELDIIVPSDTQSWQARAGVRTQTPDYHPIIGQLADSQRIWVMSAMGAKGYAFAPICAEALADIMLGAFAPLSSEMLGKLSPDRARLQTPLTS